MELKQTQYPDCHLCYALLKLCDGPKKKLAAALVKQLYFSVSFWKMKKKSFIPSAVFNPLTYAKRVGTY